MTTWRPGDKVLVQRWGEARRGEIISLTLGGEHALVDIADRRCKKGVRLDTVPLAWLRPYSDEELALWRLG